MPSSRSPHGIQFDSPLQRQWMMRSSKGRIAVNAATVAGASAASQRAWKVIPAATISSIPSAAMRRTLAACEPVRERLPLVVGHLRGIAEGHRVRLDCDRADQVRLRLDLLARDEQDPGARRAEAR